MTNYRLKLSECNEVKQQSCPQLWHSSHLGTDLWYGVMDGGMSMKVKALDADLFNLSVQIRM